MGTDYAARCFALLSASLSSPALQGPRRRSRQVLGETPSRKPSPYLSSPRARGFVRAVLLLPAGAQRRAWLPTLQKGGEELRGRNLAGLGVLQPFLMFPRHSSPCTHTKFLRGRRPNSPPNQNQAELLLYYTEGMRHSSFCMQLITEHENGYTTQFWEG